MMRKVVACLGLAFALAAASATVAAPVVDRFSIVVSVKRKLGIACDLSGGTFTRKANGRTLLGASSISVEGDLARSSIVCTLSDGRRIATQDHLGLFRGGAYAADVTIYPSRDPLRWGVLGAVFQRNGKRDVSGFLIFAEVK